MPTTYTDSLDKIFTVYFACITNETFEYKGKQYNPRGLCVSPLLLRDFICPEMCGGCCPRFSLDYLPEEEMSPIASLRKVNFNGSEYDVYSDHQDDHNNLKCRNLNLENGRCGIHPVRPFSCDFELIRFMMFADETKDHRLIQKLFGRGWMMKRVDGQQGALCEITPVTNASVEEVKRKLKRLDQWASYFKLVDNKAKTILQWINSLNDINTVNPLYINSNGEVRV